MTKVKTYFTKFFLIVLMFIMCITLSACAPSGEDFGDDYDEEFDDEFGGEEGGGGSESGGGSQSDKDVGLIGVKVLRRPLVKINEDGSVSGGYDFDGNVTDKDGNYGENADPNKKDFFASFSEDILELLFTTYGNFNSHNDFIQNKKNQFTGLLTESDNEEVNNLATQFEKSPDDFKYWFDAIRYPIVNVEEKIVKPAENGEEAIKGFVVTASDDYAWSWTLPYNAEDYMAVIEAHKDEGVTSAGFEPDSGDIQFTYEGFKTYYSAEDRSHSSLFDEEAFRNAYINDDYKNAMTYAIYSLVLGTKMEDIKPDGNGKIEIENVEATDEKSSTQLAVDYIRGVFKNAGMYVGLTERNKESVKNFILSTVIGNAATSFKSKYTDYHYADVVDAIVDYCAMQTATGTASEDVGGGDKTTVGQPWLASEVVSYPYMNFFVDDGDPDATEEEQENHDIFAATGGAFEYQSFVLMPSKEDFSLEEIWLDFKYDAGRDGDKIFDPNAALDIDVIVRWNKGDGTPIKQMKSSIHVKDGPPDVLEDGTTLELVLDDSEMEGGFGEPVKIGKFHTPDALKATAADNFTLQLNGLTNARRYYKVLDGDNGGVYGVLNEEMIEGSYCEIAFDVHKKPGDYTTNYTFYTALRMIFETPEYPDDPEWH